MIEEIKNDCKTVSIRKVAKARGKSKTTILKYKNMPWDEILQAVESVPKRVSQYEQVRDFIVEQLKEHDKISAVKLLRVVKEKYPVIKGQVRGFRDFINTIKQALELELSKGERHFTPVEECVESGKVQVDMGELVVKLDKTRRLKIYFVAFTFVYSRIMFVHYQTRAYNTNDFINSHIEQFKYFGFIGLEYIYDQTTLVCLKEKYGEVDFNKRMSQFAKKHRFKLRVCHAYDPQSKGKVERVIEYIKNDCLKYTYHRDLETLRGNGLQWLKEVANVRIHDTTQRRPVDMFIEEQPFLQSFEQEQLKECHPDKTSIISYNGIKYTVPTQYQAKTVLIKEKDGMLLIYDPESFVEVASHKISMIKGKLVKNPNHYRNNEEYLKLKTNQTHDIIRELSYADDLISRIKTDNPEIVLDQLKGLRDQFRKYKIECWEGIKEAFYLEPKVRISILLTLLKQQQSKMLLQDVKTPPLIKSACDRDIKTYMETIKGDQNFGGGVFRSASLTPNTPHQNLDSATDLQKEVKC